MVHISKDYKWRQLSRTASKGGTVRILITTFRSQMVFLTNSIKLRHRLPAAVIPEIKSQQMMLVSDSAVIRSRIVDDARYKRHWSLKAPLV